MENIENIIHLILSNHLNEVPKSFKDTLKPKNSYLVIRHSLGSLRWNFLKLFKTDKPKNNLSNKVWVIYESSNNYNALKFLKQYKYLFISPSQEFNYRFQFIIQLRSILNLFIYLKKKKKLDFYYNYIYRIGLFEESIRYLKLNKPQKIIFSNDHTPKQRALILAAKKLGIKTYYFQHACSTKYFPPLEFDVAFLDGQDAVDKYKKIGIKDCKIEKIGMIRGAVLRENINQSNKIISIGIAINELDSINHVADLLDILRAGYPSLNMILRPHPSFGPIPAELKTSLHKNNVQINNPKDSRPFEFLRNIQLLIAGNSSILLEAAIMNIIPVSYAFSDGKVVDSYGFIENGLVANCDSPAELLKFISTQKDKKSEGFHKKAAYYDESLNGEVDWKNVIKRHGLLN